MRYLRRRLPEDWLTRSQAAQLLWAAWRAKQVMRDRTTKRAVGQHVARFILVGLYSGTRSSAICDAALMPTVGRGYIDLERGGSTAAQLDADKRRSGNRQ